MSATKFKDPDGDHAVVPAREREWALGKQSDPVQAVLALPMAEFQAHLNNALDPKSLKDAHSRLEAIRRYAELERQEDAIKLDITEKLLRVARRIGELVPVGDIESVPAGTQGAPEVVTRQRLTEWRTFASVSQSKWEEEIRRAKEAGKLSARRLLEAFGKPKESTGKRPRVGPPEKPAPAPPKPTVESKPEPRVEPRTCACNAIITNPDSKTCDACALEKRRKREEVEARKDEGVDPGAGLATPEKPALPAAEGAKAAAAVAELAEFTRATRDMADQAARFLSELASRYRAKGDWLNRSVGLARDAEEVERKRLGQIQPHMQAGRSFGYAPEEQSA